MTLHRKRHREETRGVRAGRQKRIVVSFDADSFNALEAIAKTRGKPFAEIVRDAADVYLAQVAPYYQELGL